MSKNKRVRIEIENKFDPQDERIFCPNVNKSGIVGHGLLKKYYIPHLGENLCEYCEIEEDGERRNLSYYQAKKESRHLISELQNWREDILKYQNIKRDENIYIVIKSLEENKSKLNSANKSLDLFKKELEKFKETFDEKLLGYFKFTDDIFLIKDLIDECKFDNKGKLNLIGIGTDHILEAKYVWMSLLFSNMKRQNLDAGNFVLTHEIQNIIQKFVDDYGRANYECCEFVKHLSYRILPDLAKFENKKVSLDVDEVIKRLPTIRNNEEILTIQMLKQRILELEILLQEKERIIFEYNYQQVSMAEDTQANRDIIDQLNTKLDEFSLIIQKQDQIIKQRDAEISRLNLIIKNFNEEMVIRENERILELQKIISQERKQNEINVRELNLQLEKLLHDLKEIKISHENLFLANKELEALLLAEKDNAKIIEELNRKIWELTQIRDNLTKELQNGKTNNIIVINLEREIERLKTILIEKDIQLENHNKKYLLFINDIEYLQKTNESLKKQLAGHITNYSLLTNLNQKIGKRQTAMGSSAISQASLKDLPIVNVPASEIVNDDGKSVSIFENRIYVTSNNDINIETTPNNANFGYVETPSNYNKSPFKQENTENIITKKNFVEFKGRGSYININDVSINERNNVNSLRSSIVIDNTNEKKFIEYPTEIDFIEVNPTNLLLKYLSFQKIVNWINSMNNTNKIFKLNLLYKGSYENFSANRFKALCSNVSNTVVIAQTNYRKIIGLYTPLKWTQNENEELIDKSKKTFTFSIYEDEMYPVIDGKVAIINRTNCGPIFGKDEFEISDCCNDVNTKISDNFGSSFNVGKLTAERFFGGYIYTIKEYEVYRIYEEDK